MKKGKTFIVSGPSGVGKSTVLQALLSKRDDLYPPPPALPGRVRRTASTTTFWMWKPFSSGLRKINF